MRLQQKKEVGEAQQDVKDTTISPCMLKIPYFLTHILKYNKEVQDKLLKNMCNFWARVEWRELRRDISYYL